MDNQYAAQPPAPQQQPTQPSFTPTPQQSQPKKRRSEALKSVLSTLLILIIAPLVALSLTAFVFQSYEVDGPSMESTLQNKDRLIVNKMPRTMSRVTGKPYTPNRGDIIIFVKHGLAEFGDSSSDKQLIKRVIGLPGDRVVVKDGTVTIYNTEHPEGFDPDAGTKYIADVKTTPGTVDTVVKDGEVFVCGDNRVNSLDSRYFGVVSSHDIVGKLLIRVFPVDQFKLF